LQNNINDPLTPSPMGQSKAFCAPDWFEKGVELALLAPTAVNQQKFVIKLKADETVDFIDKGGILSQVDLGIVKCHFEIGSGRKQMP